MIYIPLCIYFNRYERCNNAVRPRFTFHYVSISTVLLVLCWFFLYKFTFHYVSISTFCFERTYHILHHLHSTMYLFQRSVTTFVYGCSHIYIPLCIYFNTIASGTTTVPHNDLHSTMYLFQHRKLDVSGYIQTYLHSTMYLFQPMSEGTPGGHNRNLHSTMYLFQRNSIYSFGLL